MYTRLIPLLFLLLSGKVLAFEFPVEIIEYIDDIKVVAYIDRSDIDEKSQWNPFDSAPPLSIHAAILAVRDYIGANSGFPGTKFTEIELKRIPHHEMAWHYLVKTKYTVEGKTKPHFFIVLMTGKVISAIREPEAIK